MRLTANRRACRNPDKCRQARRRLRQPTAAISRASVERLLPYILTGVRLLFLSFSLLSKTLLSFPTDYGVGSRGAESTRRRGVETDVSRLIRYLPLSTSSSSTYPSASSFAADLGLFCRRSTSVENYYPQMMWADLLVVLTRVCACPPLLNYRAYNAYIVHDVSVI